MSRNLFIAASLAVTLLASDACLAQSRRDRRDRDRGGDRNGSAVERSTPSTQATTGPSAAGRAAMDDQFRVLLERSIFARSGIAERTDRPPTTSTAPSAPPLSPEQAVVFVGVLVQDSEYIAFAENQLTRQLMLLRVGDDVARGKVVGITLDTLAYASGGSIKVIHLGQNLAGEQASTSSFASTGSSPTTSPAGTPSGPMSAVEAALRARRARGE